MNISERALRRFGILVIAGFVLSSPGCGEKPSGGTEKGVQKAPAVDRDREHAAEEALKIARQSPFPEKTRLLTEVAHLFWDTKVAPDALVDLTIALFDDHALDPSVALKEIDLFRERRPGEKQILTALTIYANAIQKVIDEKAADPRAKGAADLKKSAVLTWRDTARKAAAEPENAKNFELLQVLGQSEFANGEPKAAEAAWSRVEEASPAPPTIRRFETLMWRADLYDHDLGDSKRALELFEKADSLSKDLELGADEKWGTYVRRRIAELRQKIAKD